MDVATIVKRIRKEKNLTQNQLAQISGLSRPNISAYENGRRRPNLINLQRILDTTGYDLYPEKKLPSIILKERRQQVLDYAKKTD